MWRGNRFLQDDITGSYAWHPWFQDLRLTSIIHDSICCCCSPGSMFGSMALASTSAAMLMLSVQGLMAGQAHADDQAHPVTKTAPSTTPSSSGGIIAITLPGGSKVEVLPPISGSNWEVKVEKVRAPAGPPEVSERALPRPASRSPWNLLLKPRYWDLNHFCYLFLIPQAFLPKNTWKLINISLSTTHPPHHAHVRLPSSKVPSSSLLRPTRWMPSSLTWAAPPSRCTGGSTTGDDRWQVTASRPPVSNVHYCVISCCQGKIFTGLHDHLLLCPPDQDILWQPEQADFRHAPSG